jgi:predicted Holliday junction resolvase-like endonuclease
VTALLVVALVAAVIVIVWLAAKNAAYRARYRYTETDLTSARQDTLSRSRSVVSGKVQEHLAPLFPEFLTQFNPRDARFIGTPLDFIVFDGLDDGDDVECRRVVFVEVKTGKASLSKRERRVRDAVEAGRVEYQLVRLPKDLADLVPGADAPVLDAPDAPPALQP